MRLHKLLAGAGIVVGAALAFPVWAAEKPNILVFWGDDIGISNISAYSDGIMGYKTPNIDRIAEEGMPDYEKWSFIGYPLAELVDTWSPTTGAVQRHRR